MKSKMRRVEPREKYVEGNQQVRIEMQSFLRALDSYPERFAQDPGISFEEHRSSLVPAASISPAKKDPRRN